MVDQLYPFAPQAEWRFAISRRFNHPWVDKLYSEVLKPVLSAEGIVLECAFAGEGTEDIDFWMNRMSIILELADFHVLIDVDRTSAMEYEFQRSELIQRKHLAPALLMTFDIDGAIMAGALFNPTRLLIRRREPGVSGVRKPIHGRAEILEVEDSFDTLILTERLRECIRRGKERRLRTLMEVISPEVMKPFLIRLTGMARIIEAEGSVDGLGEDAAEFAELETSTEERLTIQANRWRQWWLDIREGNIELPSSFGDTRKLLAQKTREEAAAWMSPAVVQSTWFRRVTELFGMVQAFFARRAWGSHRRK